MDSSSSDNPNRAPPSLAEQAQLKALLQENMSVINETIERSISSLDPLDQEVLNRSKEQFLNHVSLGFWLGTLGGVTFAFRGRFNAKQVSGVPKLFYPVKGAAGSSMPKGRGRRVVKGIASGALGALVGLQVGVFTGSRAGRRTLEERPGVEDRAKAAMKLGGEEVSRMLQDRIDQSENEGGGGQRGNEFYGEDEFGREEERRERTPAEITSSRWSELRKSQASPPSSWDTLRQSQSQAPPTTTPPINKSRSKEELPEPGSDEMYGVAGNKEKESMEFEKMMERERKGGKSSEGFSSDGVWRG